MKDKDLRTLLLGEASSLESNLLGTCFENDKSKFSTFNDPDGVITVLYKCIKHLDKRTKNIDAALSLLGLTWIPDSTTPGHWEKTKK